MLQSGVFLARTKLSLAGATTSIIFVETRLLLRQMYACRDKHVFVTTKLSSRQAYFYRDKLNFVATKIVCRDKQKTCFVAINTCLSRQKLYLWQLPPMILNDVVSGESGTGLLLLPAPAPQPILQKEARRSCRHLCCKEAGSSLLRTFSTLPGPLDR